MEPWILRFRYSSLGHHVHTIQEKTNIILLHDLERNETQCFKLLCFIVNDLSPRVLVVCLVWPFGWAYTRKELFGSDIATTWTEVTLRVKYNVVYQPIVLKCLSSLFLIGQVFRDVIRNRRHLHAGYDVIGWKTCVKFDNCNWSIVDRIWPSVVSQICDGSVWSQSSSLGFVEVMNKSFNL